MGQVTQLAARLLNATHGVAQLPVCRDDWLWTTSVLGGVLAIGPLLAAMLVALIRKGTGNRYNGATCTVFAFIGGVFCLLLPWLAFLGVSRVFRATGQGIIPDGFGADSANSLSSRSCFVANQRRFLGVDRTVYDAVSGQGLGRTVHTLHLALLVGAPLVTLLFLHLQHRVALRRGPKWPSILLLLPFVALVATTGPLQADVVGQLWLGFVPVSLIGILVVFLLGKPRWSVINRSGGRDLPPAAPAGPALRGPEGYQPAARFEPEPEPTPPPLPFGRADAGPERPRPTAPLPVPLPVPQPPPVQTPPAQTPPSQPQPANPPVTLGGRFTRERRLGTGGFGTVWLARDTHLDRTVAVKFAHAPDADTEQRMRREARALAAVRHPNCVRIYDIITEADGVGIVMEYVEGPSLADAVRDGEHLSDEAAARLWSTMASALDAAHAKGVLHRDVKPSNVLLDQTGAPHLIDFGIARSQGDLTLTAAGMMVGTPDYLAPEIARGGAATPASDAWQLAATVSYALSGNPPRGRRTSAMSAMVAAAHAEPCTELPTASPHLDLLRQALDPEPEKRPTLQTINRMLTGWLDRSGFAEEGPVTTTVVVPDAGATRRLT